MDMNSCIYNNTGPIQILLDKTIGELYFRDTVEIQFDVELSTRYCLERSWCNIFSIGMWHRLPLIYTQYIWDVNLQDYRYALVYEMTYSDLREFYVYPKQAENLMVIDGKIHNLYSKFTLTSTLIILDHDIIIVNETLSGNLVRDNWYFGRYLPIMAVWDDPRYSGVSNYTANIWNGTITNLCINTFDYTGTFSPTKSPIPTADPTFSPITTSPSLSCFPQGPCDPGYVDQTKGNYESRQCGHHCDGGIYTDNNCQCACVPDINNNGCLYSTEIPMEYPQSQVNTNSSDELDIKIIIITVLCAAILILTAVAVIMYLIHRIKNKLKMDENERIDHENINLNNDVIETWLTDKCGNLLQYLDNFLENGYDTMDRIALINKVDELEEIGIELKGHQKKILCEISKLAGCNAIDPKEGENETLNS